MWRILSTGESQILFLRLDLADAERQGLTDRLQQAVRAAGGTRAVAMASDVPERTLTRYMAGASEPPVLTLAKIARATNVGLDWLVSGSETAISDRPPSDSDDGALLLPLLSAVGAAGNGVENHDVEVIDQLPFSMPLLRKLGVRPEHAHFIQISGDSMVPTIANGAICLIDTSKTRARSEGIYALVIGDELLIKRLAIGARGLTLISDNSEIYPAETLTGDELGRVKIVGKVFWTGGEV
jgi:phage repressor protein C with HTH and peptisase S24 domain